MKNSIKNSLRITAMAAASVFVLASCSEWTEPESLDINTSTMDPALRADYLKNLREYKSGAHKTVFVTFDNPTERPLVQAERLSVLPDSIDFVSLNNPANLSSVLVEEMKEVREKGTRVIYNIDFPTFEADWLAKLKEEGDLTEEDALAYFTARTEQMLALCDQLGYDGVTFTYMGRSQVSLPEADKPAYTARQQAFFQPIAAWREAHAGKTFVFVGNPQFIMPENLSILSTCDYVVVATDNANNVDDLTLRALMAMEGVEGISDKIVITTQTTRPDDEKQLYGYFGTYDENGVRQRSLEGCAQWMTLPSAGFTRAGLLIRDAQYDYYDNTLVYRSVREAIGVMNPSPKN